MSLTSKRQIGATRRAGPAGFPAQVATRDFQSDTGAGTLRVERPGTGSAAIMQRVQGRDVVVGVTDYPGAMPRSVPLTSTDGRGRQRELHVHPELSGELTPDERRAGRRADARWADELAKQQLAASLGDQRAIAWLAQVRHAPSPSPVADGEDLLPPAAPADPAPAAALGRKPRGKQTQGSAVQASGPLAQVAAQAGLDPAQAPVLAAELEAASAALQAAEEKLARAKPGEKKAAKAARAAARAALEAVQDRYDEYVGRLATALVGAALAPRAVVTIDLDTGRVSAFVPPAAPRSAPAQTWRDPQVACRALARLRGGAGYVQVGRAAAHEARRCGYSTRPGLVQAGSGSMGAVEEGATYTFLGWTRSGARIRVPGCGVVEISRADIRAQM